MGGDPAAAPFEASDDVTWFFRELIRDEPDLDVTTDATPIHGRLPVWLAGATSDEPAPKTRVAVIHQAHPARNVLEDVFGLATKYDLVVYDPQPAAHLRAAGADGRAGPRDLLAAGRSSNVRRRRGRLAIAVGAWVIGIPILNILGVLVGGFLVVLSVFVLATEIRKLLAR
jgi:hypothetical protein